MDEIRQSTATTLWLGPYKSTDGVSSSTGLTVTYYIAKNNGGFVATTGTNSESTQIKAWYKCPLTATNVNTLGRLSITAQSSSEFLDVWKDYSVVSANYFDSKYGSDYRHVDIYQSNGSSEIDTDITISLAIKEIYAKLIGNSFKDGNEYKFYSSTSDYLFSLSVATTSRSRSS